MGPRDATPRALLAVYDSGVYLGRDGYARSTGSNRSRDALGVASGE